MNQGRLTTMLLCFLPLTALFAQEGRRGNPPGAPVAVGQPEDIPIRHTDQVSIAMADALLAPAGVREHYRYLSFQGLPLNQRIGYYDRLASFLVNSFSRAKRVYPLVLLNGTVLRVDLLQLGIDPKNWDKVCAQEGYYHATVEVIEEVIVEEPLGVIINGQWRQTTTRKVKRQEKRKKFQAAAPWLDPAAISALISATQSEAPIVRADWFLANAALAPNYYTMFGLGNKEKDFLKLALLDDKLADLIEKNALDAKSVIVRSGNGGVQAVSRNNRTLTRYPSLVGALWFTHDTLTSVGDRNYLRVLENEEFDATEQIANLPNGAQVYFLTDGKGNRIDEGDIKVVYDSTAVDMRVRAGRSCIVCHSEGLRPFRSSFNDLVTFNANEPGARLNIVDPKQYARLTEKYNNDFEELLAKDRVPYVRFVAHATGGWTTQKLSGAFNAAYNAYVETDLDVVAAAREMGVTRERFMQVALQSDDPVVLGMVKKLHGFIRRDHWEESFSSMMLLERGLRPVVPVK